MNLRITAQEVRLIASNGDQVGVIDTTKALELAKNEDLDLVEIVPNQTPPVCRIMDYGKYKFEQSKKAHTAKRKQKQTQVKEIKFRPNTEEADYQVKLKSLIKFLSGGDKAKITMRFRGREMIHQDIGVKVLRRIREDLDTFVKIEQFPKLEGRQMVQIFAPNLSEKVDSTRQDKVIFDKD